MFPQGGKLHELTSKLKYALDRIKEELDKVIEIAPRVPEKSTIYEVIQHEGGASSNASNNAQSGDTSDPDEIRSAEEVVEENRSTTTATVHTTQKEMTISELFAKLSAQSNQNKEE